MHQRPGVPATGSTDRPDNPGEAAAGGPKRNHVFTHYFVGANTLIPSIFKQKDQVTMAEERLRNAAIVNIDKTITNGTIKVSVTNNGAGHSIPTGLSHVRQMWLEVRITAPDGTVLLHSGRLDAQGRVDPSALIYNTVLGDGKGRPVMNVAKAREVLKDRRIEPLKSAVETFRLQQVKQQIVMVEAKLWYRLAPQELVDSILGKGKLSIPSVLMASDKKRVTVAP
jgi:hypothetical protein